MSKIVKQLTTTVLQQDTERYDIGFWKLAIKLEKHTEPFVVVHEGKGKRYTLARARPLCVLARGCSLDEVVQLFNSHVPTNGEVVIA